jgi:hypothetical protein
MIDRTRHDEDWNEPKRPYLEIPGREYYNMAHGYENERMSGLVTRDPRAILEHISQECKIRTKITQNEVFKLGELLCLAKQCCRQTHQDFGE